LRTAIIVAGALLLGAIYFFGRPRKPGQGRRVAGAARGGFADGGRVEPTLGEMLADELAAGEAADDEARQAEMDLDATAGGAGASAGRRVSDEFDKIVTLYVAARAGEKLRGSDIVVAA